MKAAQGSTAMVLGGIGALHLAWGAGSSVPFASREELAEAVVGSDRVPGTAECVTVAALLVGAACLVADVAPLPQRVRRAGVRAVACVLAVRAGVGFAGRTDLVVPGSVAPRFVALDRRVFAPLCAALAIGSVVSLRR